VTAMTNTSSGARGGGANQPDDSAGGTVGETLSPRAVRLAALFENIPGRTVVLADLWALWAAADPASAGRPERRKDLARALEQLAAAGLATPSKKQDTSAAPHLPARITLPEPAPSPSAAALARKVVWRPELAWVVQARLTLGQVEQLRLVNNWLRDRGRDGDVIPLRERSLEVLGHEKAFDSLLVTTAFGPDRLTLELLRTFRSHPPLPVVRVGDGPVLLVIENEDTFSSIRTVLSTTPGPVGHVAWGAGGAFEASVRTCGDVPGVDRVRYFGDLDAAGLRIPRNAALAASREGLPQVTPAHGLYRSLLATNVRQVGQPVVAVEQAHALTDWIDDPKLAEPISTLLQGGARVPQEALTLTALTTERGWIETL